MEPTRAPQTAKFATATATATATGSVSVPSVVPELKAAMPEGQAPPAKQKAAHAPPGPQRTVLQSMNAPQPGSTALPPYTPAVLERLSAGARLPLRQQIHKTMMECSLYEPQGTAGELVAGKRAGNHGGQASCYGHESPQFHPCLAEMMLESHYADANVKKLRSAVHRWLREGEEFVQAPAATRGGEKLYALQLNVARIQPLKQDKASWHEGSILHANDKH